MQIEAIRAHPGSAHVTGLWHSQKSFLLHERNNNSPPAPAPAPPPPGTRDSLGRGAPEPGQASPSPPPRPFKALGEGFSQGRASPFSMETPTPPAARPHWLSGWERRRGWRGRASLGATRKPFSLPSQKVSPQRGIATLWDRCLSGRALLQHQQKEAKQKYPIP